ncbi:hypothetical protein QA596_01180 [Balneolales bacterium ANBcel1]|nr:hypothetical protein [Balneolales bacterium ANBcel1]
MKTLAGILLLALIGVQVNAHSPNASGATSASLNVSVTVVEPSNISHVAPMKVEMNGERSMTLEAGTPGSGRISIPAAPHSEMLVSVQGNRQLSDGNGGRLAFEPEIRIGRNVLQEGLINPDGTPAAVTFTESDNGSYRGIAEIELLGTLDAGEHNNGTFSAVYTVTTEQF